MYYQHFMIPAQGGGCVVWEALPLLPEGSRPIAEQALLADLLAEQEAMIRYTFGLDREIA